jgi:hypothetical protein
MLRVNQQDLSRRRKMQNCEGNYEAPKGIGERLLRGEITLEQSAKLAAARQKQIAEEAEALQLMSRSIFYKKD